MKKRLLSILLTFCLALTLLPVTARADAATTVKAGGVDLTYTGTPVYATTNTSGAVTLGGDESSYNIKFDAGTLTLRNANIQYVNTSDPALWVAGGLTVMAVGVNTVTKSVEYGNAIQANNLTLQGTGTLTATSEKEGAVYGLDNLTIKGSIALNAVSGSSPSQSGYPGLNSNGTIVIEENAVVTAVGGKSGLSTGEFGSAGICATNSITIQGNASVTAVGGDSTSGGRSVGINAGFNSTGTITIGGSAEVVAVGGKSASDSYGLYAGDGTITYTGGLLVAKGGSTATSKAMNKAMTSSGDTIAPLSGAYDSKFAVWGPDGTYKLLSNTLDLSTGDHSEKNLETDGYTWNGSTLTLKNVIVNAPDTSGAYGINIPNAEAYIVLEGVNVVSAGNSSNGISSGIYGSGSVTISGDTLITLGGSTSSGQSYGIGFPQGGISLNVGTAIAISGSTTSSYNNAGLYSGSSTNSITITGGNTIAIGGFGASSRGMFTNNNINITGGSTLAIGGFGSANSIGLQTSGNKTINITGGTGVAIAGSATTAKALDKVPQGDATHIPVLTNGSWSGKMAAWNVKMPQTITFANPGAQTFGTTPTLSATADSGLPVTFTSSTPGVATITPEGELTFVTAGTATITAHQAGNDTYAATEVSQTFTVNPVTPGAPANVIATAGDTQASVSFAPPVSNGGSAIMGYTVTVSPADVVPVNGGGSPIVVTGLTNGQAYTFTVTASNIAGTGAASNASNSVTPNSTQTITFNNPGAQTFGTTPTLSATADSGLPVTFTSSTPGVATITSGGLLTFISAGTATINANQAGNDSYLAAPEVSRSFTVNAVVPGAPIGVTATAGNGQVSISFTPPANTGDANTSYTVTSTPGGITKTGTSSPITVTSLTNGMAYTFMMTATNTAGTSVPSSASNSVTPQAPAPSGGGGGGSVTAPVSKIDNGGSTTGTNLGKLVSGGKTLTVEGDKGAKLVFDTEALKGIGGQTSSNIKVEMKDISSTHQEKLPGKQVFSLTVFSGSSTITNFGGAVTVTLPYTLKDGESANNVTVWYLASDGTMTEIPCTYDPATKLATFKVSHFSLYVVGVDTPWVNPFTDVRDSDWFYGAVAFVSRNGMMNGIGETDFGPNTSITRGMLVTMLWRLENEPSATKTISFIDVAEGKWCAKAVAWAAANNIVTGYAGKFNPDDALTREQLAAILYRYAVYKNYDVSAADSLSAYADKPSDWALSSVSWAVAKALIKGSEGNLDLAGNANRAQTATILQRFIENTVK